MSKRVDLPYSGNTSCEIRLDNKKIELVFTRDNKQVAKKNLVGDPTEEALVDVLASSGIDFTTFSAVYDAASILVQAAKELQAESLEKKQIFDTAQVEAATAQPKFSGNQYNLPADIDSSGLGDLILDWEVPYSDGLGLLVFRLKRKLVGVLIKERRELFRTEIVEKINEKRAYKLLDESGVDFVQASTKSLIADKMVSAVQQPQQYPILAKEAQLPVKGPVSKSPPSPSQFPGQPVVEKTTSPEFLPTTSEVKDTEQIPPSVPMGLPEDVGMLLDQYSIPYSEGLKLVTYFNAVDSKFTLVFMKGFEIIFQRGLPSQAEKSEIAKALRDSNLEFVSLSVREGIIDRAYEAVAHPEELLERSLSSGPATVPEIQPPSSAQSEEESPTFSSLVSEESSVSLQEPVDIGEFVTEIKIPYSHDTISKIFWNRNTKKFALSFWREGAEVDQALVDEGENEDEIWSVLSKAKIEFISMSVISDAAATIAEIFQDPQKYIRAREIGEGVPSAESGLVAEGRQVV
ncbi:MAG TPA: hypothetical protein VJ044_02535, partial [Candidatus Hodarchaeales archaeon]|nr:hypothetical protein [Candidatus Hodarchaeales archaeon]